MRYPVTRQVDCPVSIQRRMRRAVELFLAHEREEPDEVRRDESELISELRRNGSIRRMSID